MPFLMNAFLILNSYIYVIHHKNNNMLKTEFSLGSLNFSKALLTLHEIPSERFTQRPEGVSIATLFSRISDALSFMFFIHTGRFSIQDMKLSVDC